MLSYPAAVRREARQKIALANAIKKRLRFEGAKAMAAAYLPNWVQNQPNLGGNNQEAYDRYVFGQGKYRKRKGVRRYKKRRYRGKGGYFGEKIGGFLGGLIGQSDAGARWGSAAGDALFDGSKAGVLLDAAGAAMRGRGAYTSDLVTNQTIVDGASAPEVPSFGPASDTNSILITHREYVRDVYGGIGATSTPFTNSSLYINPGIEDTFPWLSQVACNYDEYTLHQCIFTFRSTTADFGVNNGQMGSIIMATQYNANADPFSDKSTMMQYEGAMSCKSSQSMQHGVECDPKKLSASPGKYIRTSPLRKIIGVEQTDLSDYDHGQFNLATTDLPSSLSGQLIGELWVSYTVELRKPKIFSGKGLDQSRDVFLIRGQSPTSQIFGVTNSGNSRIYSGADNSIGGVLTTTAGVGGSGGAAGVATYTLPDNFSGTITVRLWAYGSSFVQVGTTSMAITKTGNITDVGDVGLASTGFGSGGAASSTEPSYITENHYRISKARNGVKNTIVFTATNPTYTAPGSWSNVYITVEEYNQGLSYATNGTNDQIQWATNNIVTVPV